MEGKFKGKEKYTIMDNDDYGPMDRYSREGQKADPFLMIPFDLLDNIEFMKFLRSPESVVWFKLVRYIIRATMKQKIGNFLYNEYYKKGILAAQIDMETIRETTGIPTKSMVSMYVKKLEEKGYIKKHKKYWYGATINIYELGTHDMGPNKWETFYLFKETKISNISNELDKFVK